MVCRKEPGLKTKLMVIPLLSMRSHAPPIPSERTANGRLGVQFNFAVQSIPEIGY